MNTCIKEHLWSWLKQHPSIKQWLWFVALWVSGLLTVTLLAYPLKFLMKGLS